MNKIKAIVAASAFVIISVGLFYGLSAVETSIGIMPRDNTPQDKELMKTHCNNEKINIQHHMGFYSDLANTSSQYYQSTLQDAQSSENSCAVWGYGWQPLTN